ncbi:transcription elongation factor GreA [compost metagenome]
MSNLIQMPEGHANNNNEQIAALRKELVTLQKRKDRVLLKFEKEESALVVEISRLMQSQKSGSTVKRNIVVLGSTVDIEYADNPGKIETLILIEDSSKRTGNISEITLESPIGRTINKKGKGDIVIADTPGGKLQIKIVDIR